MMHQEAVRQQVHTVLAELREKQRQALVERYLAGWSCQEMAERSGIKESSAWQSLYRARQAFAKTYERLMREEEATGHTGAALPFGVLACSSPPKKLFSECNRLYFVPC